MIKINKPVQAPEVLRVQGKRRRRTHCTNFDKHEADYRDGTRTFPFDATIYAHETVKAALKSAHHGKCCFCETKIGAEGDVEHFRPKAGCCQTKNGSMTRPGYYWLAYEWDNLLWACGPCNQRFKKNLFPLLHEGDRATCHHDDVQSEQPLLINPAETDPANFISFRKEVAFPVDDNAAGKSTITVLGLNRQSLLEDRRDHLGRLTTFRNLLKSEARLQGDPEGEAMLEYAKQFLRQAAQDDAKYAGMARAAQARDFRISLQKQTVVHFSQRIISRIMDTRNPYILYASTAHYQYVVVSNI